MIETKNVVTDLRPSSTLSPQQSSGVAGAAAGTADPEGGQVTEGSEDVSSPVETDSSGQTSQPQQQVSSEGQSSEEATNEDGVKVENNVVSSAVTTEYIQTFTSANNNFDFQGQPITTSSFQYTWQ